MALLRSWSLLPFHRRSQPTEVVTTYQSGTITVSDPAIRARLRYQGLTEQDLGVLAHWRHMVEPALESVVDTFYSTILNDPEVAAVLRAHTTVDRQRPMLTRYIQTMFSGALDDQFVEYRRRVGVVHDQIDLDTQFYLGMYEVLRQGFVGALAARGVAKADCDRFNDALIRMLEVDMGLCMAAFIESRRERSLKTVNAVVSDLARVLGGVLGSPKTSLRNGAP